MKPSLRSKQATTATNNSDTMSDPEKDPKGATATTTGQEPSGLPALTGWKYRPIRLGPLTLPWYASPQVQLIIVAFVCFMCPGMFNALGGMGGGGQEDATTADLANVALYSTFAAVGFFAGTFVNRVGVKGSLSFGGLGYCIYVASFLSYNHNQNRSFCLFAGALLGACAGILWAAQGVIMISYPPEGSKGRYIATFWIIFNLGGVIGSLIPLGQNIHTKTAGTVSDGTYIGFLILTLIGAALAWCLVNSTSVVRDDGSRVIAMKNPSWWSEIKGLFETLRTDLWILLLFPMFWVSNWFYTYQQNGVNGARFDVRTRALNSVLYWGAQMVGALVFGSCLDITRIDRRYRARGAWAALFVVTMVVYGGGYAFEKQFTRATAAPGPDQQVPTLDWNMKEAVGPIFLYLFYGMFDAFWQTTIYWLMGALSNNSRRLANYVGFYKGIQSAGAAVQWRLDSQKESFLNEFASSWGLLAGALVIALPLVWFRVKEYVPVEEDLKFTDETLMDVAPTAVKEEIRRESVTA